MGDAECVQVAREAMATIWELILCGERPGHLRAAGKEALDEVDRIEAQLSFFRESSDLYDINSRAAGMAVPTDPRVFRLLARAQALSAATGGAFDPSVAPLIQCWGFAGGRGQLPEDEDIEEARSRVGMQHVILDEESFTVRFDREGVQLDLGAIGKGYAVDRALGILREFEVDSALLHGGTSTIYALGSPPAADAWRIAIQRPFAAQGSLLAQVHLRDEALSISAPHGKWFEANGRRYGHVIDPRSGWPSGRALLAGLITASATDSDALSTALLTLGAEGLPLLQQMLPDSSAMLAIEREDGDLEIVSYGGRFARFESE